MGIFLVDHLDQASHVYFWPPFLSCHWACRWAIGAIGAIALSGPQLGTTLHHDNPEIFLRDIMEYRTNSNV